MLQCLIIPRSVLDRRLRAVALKGGHPGLRMEAHWTTLGFALLLSLRRLPIDLPLTSTAPDMCLDEESVDRQNSTSMHPLRWEKGS